jgi:hypothetical protein
MVVALAVAVILVLTVAGLSLQPRSDNTAGAPLLPAADLVPAIAVLPFVPQNDSLSAWGEGLMDLVSMDLRGIPGLRPLDSRVVLAHWREKLVGGEVPMVATALGVAERAGGRYAVVGKVIAEGRDLLLTAGVYEVAGHRMLGTARSQGPTPDSTIFTRAFDEASPCTLPIFFLVCLHFNLVLPLFDE